MSFITRRHFLHSLTTTAAAPVIICAQRRAGRALQRLPLAFSTLACPTWDWKTILQNAAQLGYAAIELRGLLGEMDLTKVPEFRGERLKASLKDVSALGLKISDLGASSNLHEPDEAKRVNHLDEAKRFVDLAYQMKVPYVRVFPNDFVKGEERSVTIARIISGLRELGDYARGSSVSIIVETHGGFVRSPELLQLMKGAAMPNVALLWDTHHTFVGGEKPDTTWQQLGKYVRHAHLKDSVADSTQKNGRRYVLTGTGEVPVQEIVRTLVTAGYHGLYSYEWEKRNYAALEEPDIALPHYAKVMREYLDEAGYK